MGGVIVVLGFVMALFGFTFLDKVIKADALHSLGYDVAKYLIIIGSVCIGLGFAIIVNIKSRKN